MVLAFREARTPNIFNAEYGVQSGEATVFCPRCKAFQTVWLSDNTLMPTRKFYQREGRIYHDCGSSRPCQLYFND